MSETRRIYLDYNATTPISKPVRDFFIQELDYFANGSSLHTDGRFAAKRLEKARTQVASLINANSSEIIFTSGGSEANNTVFNSMISHDKKAGRKLIVTSAIEHPCVIEASKRLSDFGFEVIRLAVDKDGIVDIAEYKKILEKKPLLISIMAANNEIGTIQDIKTLAAMAHDVGALFHTDAVQAAGKIPVDAKDWDIDYLTLSGHKIYAPKGVGALYIKNGTPISPFVLGGHQEHGLRAGTYNIPSVAAFGYAAELAKQNLAEYEKHTRALRNKLRDGFLSKIPNIKINGHPEKVLPNTLDVSFKGAEGEAILLHLDLLGVSVSTGSACASGNLEPSHVLLATGLGPELAHGSIRFSFGIYSTESDVDFILDNFPPVLEKLRRMSTVYLV